VNRCLRVAGVLKEYFDPSSGRFQERVERLIQRDGDLEQVMRRQIGSDGSVLAKTLAEHIGENSAIMRLLDPDESDSLVHIIRHRPKKRSNMTANGCLLNSHSITKTVR